jgi:hypothetical protein
MLVQVIKELKSTRYRPTSAVLGSKTHYCVHKDVTGGTVSIEEGCEALQETDDGCPYKSGVHRLLQSISNTPKLKVHSSALLTRPQTHSALLTLLMRLDGSLNKQDGCLRLCK